MQSSVFQVFGLRDYADFFKRIKTSDRRKLRANLEAPTITKREQGASERGRKRPGEELEEGGKVQARLRGRGQAHLLHNRDHQEGEGRRL